MTRARYINDNGQLIYVRSEPLKEMNAHDFFWLIGLLEGEGTFGIRNNCLFVKASTCDQDVRDKLEAITGTGTTYDRPPTAGSKKHVYIWSLDGWFGRELMLKIKQHMSVRRQEQIDRALSQYKYKGPAIGSNNFNTKLQPADVKEIRRLARDTDLTQREIGLLFGIAKSSTGGIVRRHTWKHV